MKKILSSTGLFVAVVLFVAFNVFANVALKSARIDLTANKLYTLSDGTKNVLRTLTEPITLRFYFSKKVASNTPGLDSFAQRVQELLEEYVTHSNGHLTLEIADPEPFSEEEDRAVGFGLQGVPATASGEMLYFGLAATNTTDQEEIIPFFQENREEALEYEITKIIYNLTNPKKPVVGLMTSLPMEGNPLARMQNPNADSQAWFITEQIQQLFELRNVPLTTSKIEPDVDVLLVVHPQGITPDALFAIDQYVLGGGKLLAFIDPYCDVQQVRSDPQNPMAAMTANRSSDLGPLLGAWGLELAPESLAGDRDNAMRVGYQNQPVDYIVWLALTREKGALSKDDFVTSQLGTVNLANAGILRKAEGATTTITPLMETSANSMQVPKSSIQFSTDPGGLLERFVSGNEKLMLAARVHGSVKSAYPDGKPVTENPSDGSLPTEEDNAASLKESSGPINVIVVADADLLEDRYWTRTQNLFGQRIAIPMAANADFAINAIDNLSGSNDLISLRSRGRFNRPFDRVVEIRREAETNYRQKAKELEDKLRDTEQKLAALQSTKDAGSALILSPEQQAELERFRDERVKTRKELRKVQHELQKDIESLGTWLKFANIGFVPMIVVIVAIVTASLRSSRGARPQQNGTKSS